MELSGLGLRARIPLPRSRLMGSSAWTTVAVRVFVFSVLPVLLATLHVRLDTSAKERLWKVIVGVGATVVHIMDILQEGNLAAGNSLQNVANLLKPALLIPMLIVSRRSESTMAVGPSFDRWRMAVVGTAGIVTAVVGTGFGLGSSFQLVLPATLVAAVLAAGTVARSASISRDS